MKFVDPAKPSRKSGVAPDFLYAAPAIATCAAFSKESRMKFVDPAKPSRKSGVAPSPDLKRQRTPYWRRCPSSS
jgi:hypothetical protein